MASSIVAVLEISLICSAKLCICILIIASKVKSSDVSSKS